MSDNKIKEKSATVTQEDKDKITPLRCFTGGAISGGLAIAAYLLTKSVVMTYSTMPIKFNNPMAIRIAATVRTLIMGVTTMATFVFLMVTVGLMALGIKLIIEKMKGELS
ncbi:MAG: DUF3082 domain-containing protein [Cyanobacteria bacterium]|nr:DUF3082 domain-containing protein [Cyanobacteria bacterium CG_2015-16_32_12]NCO77226.1 DUF3082 domain-containing protein [Cyanobacteria bacterium CG_2015-22_32_23]NCQ04632.1 DUF3082 domain-containing protein [Cyanobacteria bacterium CG_2015-09_32_10]NCQ42817.1 DUF3082 domain-containing protein [Cyanobacteria bacterium CG_2015-04_32_10]NCS86062.1 DUF3082 domain-containing protein [Cyanobacteria bacterium CG_2015-02_32_10]